ncbi:MAG: hypothetical protein LBT83_03865 [Tannerella sp.]|jgi:hypothetical protein|nr:hypothetical protein [Tannerella sp.]
MKKVYIGMLLLVTIPLWMQGQVDYQEEKTKINTIKKDARYIYGEGIAETGAEALLAAEQSLHSEIMRVISEKESLQDAESVIITAIKKNSSQIKLKRGTMDRVFLYVNKENISAGDQVMEIYLGDETPTDIETVIEIEEVATVELPAEPERKTPARKEPDKITKPAPKAEQAPSVISDILAASDFSTLQTYLQGQKAAHKIMWGKVGTEINPTWYIIAVSGNEIKAVFDKGLNRRKNFLTGENEEMSNYSNCTKIWLTIYE